MRGRKRKDTADALIADLVQQGQLNNREIADELARRGFAISRTTVHRRVEALRPHGAPDGYISLQEAADILGVSRHHIHTIQHQLGMQRIGWRIWVECAAVEAYKKNHAEEEPGGMDE